MSTRGSAREAARVEFRVRRRAAQRPAVPGEAVAIGMGEAAEIRGAEGLQPRRRGLGDLARGVDLVVQHHQRAEAARLRAGGDAHAR